MDLRIDLSAYAPQKTYSRMGTKVFLDPFRQSLVPLSPENLLLYKMAMYVHHVMGVPKGRMAIQQSLRKYGVDSTKVVSIVVHDMIDGKLQPVALIDCAAPGNPLSFAPTTQLEEFAKSKGILYLVVTNGVEIDAYISRADRLTFWKIDNVPHYQTICTGHAQAPPIVVTAPVEDLKGKHAKSKSAKLTGTAKPTKAVPNQAQLSPEHMVQVTLLNEALKDTKHKIGPQEHAGIKMVRDCGNRKKSIKLSEHSSEAVRQRAFIIEDFHKNHQLMCIDIDSEQGHPPTLSVTLDNVDHRQVVYALDFKSTLDFKGNTVIWTVDLGAMFKSYGPDFIEGLKVAIAEKTAPESASSALHLKDSTTLYLGSIATSETIYCNQPEIAALCMNLLAFALILDEYRETIKRVQKKAKK